MSDNSSNTQMSQDDSKFNCITDNVLEDERQEPPASDQESDDDLYAYNDEPLADDEWISRYNEQFSETRESKG